MKYLKIDNNKGYYWNGEGYREIDKINKNDLMTLLNLAEKPDFELDNYNPDLLANKAHQIIYENLYKKFEQFLNDKDQFKKQSADLYKEAMSKYSVEVSEDEERVLYEEPNSDTNFNSIEEEDDLPF